QNLVLDTAELCRAIVFRPLQPPTRIARLQAPCTLDAAARHLGVAIQDRHTALGDAMATAQIFQRLLARIDNGSGPLRRLAQEASLFSAFK
ncbi:MAG: hypothetical protein JSW39_09670, partial [Desulfobacterales bacterium]